MVLKPVFATLGVIVALVFLGIGVLAAYGVTIYVDFSSPDSIEVSNRPRLQAGPDTTLAPEQPRFRFNTN